MKQIVKFILLTVVTFFTVTFIFCHREVIWKTYSLAIKDYYLIILFTLGFYLLIIRRRFVFVENLLHELTHMLFSMLTFRKVSGLYVSEINGTVYTEGSQKSILVTLSPYFFPLLTALVIVVFSLIRIKFSDQIIIASYVVSLLIAIKQILVDPNEIFSTGPGGYLLILILNFWVSYLLFRWLTSGSININEIIKTTYDGFIRII